MYTAVLVVHSWLRWLVIVLALIAVTRAIIGISQRRSWTATDQLVGKLLLRTFDVQVLLGLLLYFLLSPITRAAMGDFGSAMQVSAARFWALEHVFGMVVAMLLAYRGQIRVRAVQESGRKHKIAAIFYTLALVAMLASIPWPGTPNERPMFRW